MSAFSYRPGGYKFGIILLFFATVAVIVGVIAPYWASTNYSSVVNATSGVSVILGLNVHEGPWMLCVRQSANLSNVSTSALVSPTSCGTFHLELAGWFHAVRALVSVSVALLLVACVFALVTNCCRKQPGPRKRILEPLVFLGGILAMAGSATYDILRKENSPTSNAVVLNDLALLYTVLRGPAWTYDWGIYLSGGAGILAVLTSFIIGANNKKLEDYPSYPWFDNDVGGKGIQRTATGAADNRRQADNARMADLGPTSAAVCPRTDGRGQTVADFGPTAVAHWPNNERMGGLGVQNTNVDRRLEAYPWFEDGRDNAVGQRKKATAYPPYAAEAKNGVREGFQNQRNVEEFPHYASKNRKSQNTTEIQSSVPDLVRGRGPSGLSRAMIEPGFPPVAEFGNADFNHAQFDQIQPNHGNFGHGQIDPAKFNLTNLHHARFSHAKVDHTKLDQGNVGMRKTTPDTGVHGGRDFGSRPAGRDDTVNNLSPRPKSQALSARPRTAYGGGYDGQWSDLWSTSASKEFPPVNGIPSRADVVRKPTLSYGEDNLAFDGNYPGYIGRIPSYERNKPAVEPPPYEPARFSHGGGPGKSPVRGRYPQDSSPTYQQSNPALEPPAYGRLHMPHLGGAGNPPVKGSYPQDDKLPPYQQNKPTLGPPAYGRVPLTHGGGVGNPPFRGN